MIACIGNGVRRFHLKSEAFQTIQSRAQPSSQSRVQADIERPPLNPQTRLINNLVWALDAKEVKYDMTIHGVYVLNLPRHINASPVINASVELLIASIEAARGSSCKSEALELRIDAISTLRKYLMAGGNAIDKITTIWIIDTCKTFIEFQKDSRASHDEVLAHLLHETKQTSTALTPCCYST